MVRFTAVRAIALVTILAGVASAGTSTAMTGDAAVVHNGRIVGDRAIGWRSVVFTMRSDGSDRRRLAWISRTRQGGFPAWSPSGRRIAYGNFGDLWVMGAGGRHKTKLVDRSAADSDPEPSWAPHGRRPVCRRDGFGMGPAV